MYALSFSPVQRVQVFNPLFLVNQGPVSGLGPGLAGYSCEFDPAHYSDQLFSAMDLPIPAALQDAVVKRKAEFFAGRFFAAILLHNLGLSSQVAVASSRAPVWPRGANGAITHSRRHALCVVTTEDLLVGVDIEHHLSPDRARRLEPSIISPEEHALLPHSLPYHQAITLCFSAKESAYKAIYPLVGRYVDFLQASIQINHHQHTFSIRLSSSILAPGIPGDTAVAIDGHFKLCDDHVLTYISIHKNIFNHLDTGDKNYDIAS
jgi:4'-phosphopantetheinyl transferase EntD